MNKLTRSASRSKTRARAQADHDRGGTRGLRGLLEAAPESILVVDQQGHVVHINTQTERLFGYGREEVIDRPVRLLLPELQPSAFEKSFLRRAIPATDNRMIELVAQRKNGNAFAAELSLGVLESEGESLVMAFVRDTSDRRRIERTLRQGEAYFRLLCLASEKLARSLEYRQTLQHAAEIAVPEFADCCVVLGIDDGGTLGAAATWQRKGLAPELVEALGLAHRSLARDSATGLAQVLRDRRTMRTELARDGGPSAHKAQRKMRELGLHSAIVVPLLARKQLLGVLCCYALAKNRYSAADQDVAEDLGHRAALALDNALLHEQARVTRDAAQRAAGERDELLSIVAHDLRNPLNTISLWAQSLLMAPAPLSTSRTLKAADLIHTTARRMSGMIDDLLTHASVEAGVLAIEREPRPVSKIVAEVVEAYAPMALERDLELVGKCTATGTVLCDPRRIHQVLGNLVANAFKFTPRGGTVSIEGAQQADTDLITFQVSDTGVGIAPADTPHIFQRNWRGPDDKSPGLGLGLHIVRLLIEAHGGTVEMRSVVSQGTTFTIRLPGGASEQAPTRA